MFFGVSTLIFADSVDVSKSEIDWKDFFKKIFKSNYDNVLILELIDNHNSKKNIDKILIEAREFLGKL